MTSEIPNDRFELITRPVCGSEDLSSFLSIQYGKLKQKSSLDYSALGVTPELISIERRRGEFVKAHFVEHVTYFPVKTLDLFMARHGFRPLPFAHYALVKTLGDAIKCLGAWVLMGLLGRGSWRGYFQRSCRMEEEGHGR